jgi:hypothetical protein
MPLILDYTVLVINIVIIIIFKVCKQNVLPHFSNIYFLFLD